MKQRTLITIAAALAVMQLRGAAPPATLVSTEVESFSGLWHLAAPLYSNPALNQWRLQGSITAIEAGFSRRIDDGSVDPRNGWADHDWQGGARTYVRHRTSTLWGHARYANGRTSGVVWRETSDAPLLYPYLTADSTGGNFEREVYSFGGGYADRAGRWAWGAAASYDAKLEYRTVDPRPRNVCSTLNVSAGAAFAVTTRYSVALSVNWMRYKQSNDIMFKSEMGIDKIFHLTGPGMHYDRFAGTGLTVNYQGNRLGLGGALCPSDGRGAFLSVDVSRFTFDNILTDLNKLPMASVWHNALEARAGWLAPRCGGSAWSWGAAGDISASRRHGRENLFGDAASSIYPSIGSLTMFGENRFAAGATLRLMRHFGPVSRVGLVASTRYGRCVSAYVEPRRRTLVKGTGLTLGADASVGLPRNWLLNASASAGLTMPGNCELQWNVADTDPQLASLERIELHAFRLASSRRSSAAASLGVTAPLTGGFRIGCGAGWQRNCYINNIHSDNYNINISLIF